MDGERLSQQVRKRRVFYIPGYDPFPPRRYRELYRTEADKQAAISGYQIGIKALPDDDRFGWKVGARIGGAPVTAEVEVLVWSDLVQHSMRQGIAATYAQLARTVWTYVASGAFRRLMMLRKGPVIAALYPVGMLLLQLLLAFVAGSILGNVIEGGLDWLMSLVGRAGLPGVAGWFVWPWLFWAAGWAVTIAVLIGVLRFFKAQDHRFFAYYLMHDFAFTARHKGAYPPEIEARLTEFADRIAAALKDDVDEVLVVGHSSGAILAVTVLADLIRSGRAGNGHPALSLLTLGQVIPMVSFLPRAYRLRSDLRYLAARAELAWIDVTAPGDGCCHALCDPVAVTGVSPRDKIWPLVFSAAFTEAMSEEQWSKLRWRFFRLHFQYLCAFEKPRDFDYFQITAGPLTLAERYDGRPQSRSRIDVAVSRYTSTAA